MTTKRKLWYSIGALALTLVVAATSVGITIAALQAKVSSGFSISYTAKNVSAKIKGSYVTNDSDTEHSLGDDLVFNGDEAQDTTKSFDETKKPNVTINNPTTDYLEMRFTIENTGENGFGVTLTLTGLETSNFTVSYAKSYRANTTTAAQFGAAAGANALSDVYATAAGTSKCVVDVSVRVSVKDISASGTATGNFNFVLDGLAEDPSVELFNSSNKKFVAKNINKMFQQISGKTDASISTITQMLEDDADHRLTSADMVANSQKIAATANGVSARGADAEIIIELGGLKWTPVFLSKTNEWIDGKTHDVILTLWLADNYQDAWKDRQADEGEYYGFIDGALFSDWSYNWQDYRTDMLYPSAMYGTSYMRAVTLNNGGQYALDGGNSLSAEQAQDENNPFAAFTMEQFGLTDYLVKPVDVVWQWIEQSAGVQGVCSYNLSNENWSDKISDNGFSSPDYNYAHKDGNDVWKNDYLWLPSLTETGYDSSYNSHTGMWATSTAQRKLTNQTTSELNTAVGSKNDTITYNYSWLRSGSNAYRVYALNPSGSVFGGDEYKVEYVGYSCAVRPALHLNLTAIANSL